MFPIVSGYIYVALLFNDSEYEILFHTATSRKCSMHGLDVGPEYARLAPHPVETGNAAGDVDFQILAKNRH